MRATDAEWSAFFTALFCGCVPEKAPQILYASEALYLDQFLFRARKRTLRFGMWAVVDKCWTLQLARWIGERRVLEVMGGMGWLARALSEHGVDILTTDDFSWRDAYPDAPAVFDVSRCDAIDAARRYALSSDVLLVSWPPYNDETIERACEVWAALSGGPIIYIGEPEGGCNAGEGFWAHFQLIPDAPHITLPAWPWIHDMVILGNFR